jgi:hypothetical protein
MSRLLLSTAAAVLLAPALVSAEPERTEFTTLGMGTCAPFPACLVPQRGDISCPGGGEALPSLFPPWCEAGSRTRVRDRVLVYTVVQTTDPQLAGTITFRLNMNLDTDTFSGPMWGTYSIEVPDQGRWEGTWTGRAHSVGYWTYRLMLHGTGGLDGLFVRADAVWRVGQGEQLVGYIFGPRFE